MNSRDRVRQTLRCCKPDRLPKALGFFPQTLTAASRIDPEEYFRLDIRFAEFGPPENQNKFLAYMDGLPEDIHLGSQAQLRTYHEWQYHPQKDVASPLSGIKSLREMAEFVFPDLSDPARYSGLAAKVKQWHNQGLAVAGAPPHLGGQLFEAAWRLRGFENFMMDLAQRGDLASYLLDQLTSMLVENLLILARADVDILLLDDDVATPTQLMISPDMWRDYFKPRLAAAIQLAREVSPELLVFYHCDGNFTQLLPDLIDIGVNVVNPVQPDCMDAVAIKREFGDKLAIWGAVGSAGLWDRGKPDQIVDEVRRCIASLGPEGFLPAPAYDIDFAPYENIAAFIDAVNEFGKN
jgi:uroporphyrinogen decarboxylase